MNVNMLVASMIVLDNELIVQILNIMRYRTGSQCNDLRSGTG